MTCNCIAEWDWWTGSMLDIISAVHRGSQLTANMKVLLLFGFVAVALADISRFDG